MPRSFTLWIFSLLTACAVCPCTAPASAAKLLVSNVFKSSVDLYETDGTLLQENFISPLSGGLVIASNIVVGPNGNIYVSSNLTGQVIVYNHNGQPQSTVNLSRGSAPSGLAFDAGGKLYVGDQASSAVFVFDPSLTPIPSETILIPGVQIGGIDFDNAGRLFITSFGTSAVYVHDSGVVNLFADATLGGLMFPAGIEVGQDGSVYVANIFGNSISKFASNGDPVDGLDGPGFPFITIPLADYSVPNGISFPGNAPSDIIFDTNGDLLIAFLGPTNPNETPHPLGGLLRYSTSGQLLDELQYPVASASSLALLTEAVPEPATYALGLAGMIVFGLWRWKVRR